MPSVVVLSPHFDDAVLSTWSLLASERDVRVVNVFAGAPAAGTVGRWDATTGVTDSAEHVRRRAAEDSEALAALGREAVNLAFLDAQYREPEVLDALGGAPPGPEPAAYVSELRAAIEPELAGGAEIWAPAAIGGHPDHQLTAAVALELADEGVQIVFYADIPYAIAFGWPGRVTGAEERGSFAERSWDYPLCKLGAPLELEVRTLAEEDARRKLRSMQTYETQIALLEAVSGGRLTDLGHLRYEVAWGVREGSA